MSENEDRLEIGGAMGKTFLSISRDLATFPPGFLASLPPCIRSAIVERFAHVYFAFEYVEKQIGPDAVDDIANYFDKRIEELFDLFDQHGYESEN